MNSVDRPDLDGQRAGSLSAGISLGRWAGVPIGAHWSTAATLALFTWLLADTILPSAVSGHTRGAYWAVGAVTAVVFLATLLAHELGHALTARHYGMKIKRITLWMLGGVTELDGDAPSARADAWIAASGSLISIGLGLIGAAVVWATGFGGLLGAALVWLVEVSIVLGLFNLLPGAPLDGGRLLRALLWRHYRDRTRAAIGAARAGQVLGAALVGLGLVAVVFSGIDGVWLALIGWFILSAAKAERYGAGLERLRGMRVAQIMSPSRVVAPDWWTIRQLLDQLWQQPGQDTIPLVDFAGQVTGVVSLARLDRVPPGHRDTTRLRDIAAPATTMAPAAQVAAALAAIQRGATVVIVDAGRSVGLISPAELTRALRLAALLDRAPHDGERHRSAA